MEPAELIQKIISIKGPCLRTCAYCPESLDLGEIKECVENLIRENYDLQQRNDMLMKDIIRVVRAYQKETGRQFDFGGDDL